MSLAFLKSQLDINSTTSQSFFVQANPGCRHITIFHSVKLFKELALNYSEFVAIDLRFFVPEYAPCH